MGSREAHRRKGLAQIRQTLANALSLTHQFGCDRNAAICDACRHHCELQRRSENKALANADDERFSFLPGHAIDSQLPVACRHETIAFGRQLDTEFLTKAKPPRHGGDIVDTNSLRHLVKVEVA